MNCRVMRLMGPHRLPKYLFGGILKENGLRFDLVSLLSVFLSFWCALVCMFLPFGA